MHIDIACNALPYFVCRPGTPSLQWERLFLEV